MNLFRLEAYPPFWGGPGGGIRIERIPSRLMSRLTIRLVSRTARRLLAVIVLEQPLD
jgi:hypothetical protein